MSGYEFVQRAKVLIVQNQHQDAVRVCRLGLLAHPSLVEGRLVLGMALMSLGRFDEVLAEMRVALDLDKKSPLGHLLKGEALFRKGDVRQAAEVLERARQLDPLNEKVSSLLDEVRRALGAARRAGFGLHWARSHPETTSALGTAAATIRPRTPASSNCTEPSPFRRQPVGSQPISKRPGDVSTSLQRRKRAMASKSTDSTGTVTRWATAARPSPPKRSSNVGGNSQPETSARNPASMLAPVSRRAGAMACTLNSFLFDTLRRDGASPTRTRRSSFQRLRLATRCLASTVSPRC